MTHCENANVIEIYKPVGFNSADMVREQKELRKCDKICYAGRLDPMAHGKMRLLLNEEVKNMQHHVQKDKTYQFKVLLGLSTDTTDVLGFINKCNFFKINFDRVIVAFLSVIGKYKQNFHTFSSKPCKSKVDGKSRPLWFYTTYDRLGEIDIPYKYVHIYDIIYNFKDELDFSVIRLNVLGKLELLMENGHLGYRTMEIIKYWEMIDIQKSFTVLTFTTKVSSGTYIRQLVQDISDMLRIPMLAYDINRLSFDD